MNPSPIPSPALDPDKITSGPGAHRIGRKVLVFAETVSTNDIAARYICDPANDGLVIFAEKQTAGRGRTGASWHSKPGQSLLFSVLLLDHPCSPGLLSLTTAVAVASALNDNLHNSARIKWPNDILIHGRKVAGILLETRRTPRTTAQIIGIGVNCLQQGEDFPEEIRSIATSLSIETGSPCDRTSVARRLLADLDHWFDTASTCPSSATQAWRDNCEQLHHRVRVVCNGQRFTGHCMDIDPEKGLVLRLDTGAIRMFDAAHTSIDKNH